eukprot:m.145913 g.145913  ORF g.145913 m.145913 type:complete len:582 (+) comp14121_c0_seq1:182-1927(+)
MFKFIALAALATVGQVAAQCDFPIDIVFALDNTGSITKQQQDDMAKFVKDVTAQFTVSNAGAHVAVTTFMETFESLQEAQAAGWSPTQTDNWRDPEVLLTLSNGVSQALINQTMDEMAAKILTFTQATFHPFTWTYKTFDLLANTILTEARRGDVPCIVIIVTDGKFTDHSKDENAADAFHLIDGPTTYAVAVGDASDYNLTGLEIVAGDSSRVQLGQDFDELATSLSSHLPTEEDFCRQSLEQDSECDNIVQSFSITEVSTSCDATSSTATTRKGGKSGRFGLCYPNGARGAGSENDLRHFGHAFEHWWAETSGLFDYPSPFGLRDVLFDAEAAGVWMPATGIYNDVGAHVDVPPTRNLEIELTYRPNGPLSKGDYCTAAGSIGPVTFTLEYCGCSSTFTVTDFSCETEAVPLVWGRGPKGSQGRKGTQGRKGSKSGTIWVQVDPETTMEPPTTMDITTPMPVTTPDAATTSAVPVTPNRLRRDHATSGRKGSSPGQYYCPNEYQAPVAKKGKKGKGFAAMLSSVGTTKASAAAGTFGVAIVAMAAFLVVRRRRLTGQYVEIDVECDEMGVVDESSSLMA